MTLGTRRLIGWLAAIAAVLVIFDKLTGSEWTSFVGSMVGSALRL